MIRPLVEAGVRRRSGWPWVVALAAGFAVGELLLLRSGVASGLGRAEGLRQVLRAAVFGQCLLVGLAAPALGLGTMACARQRETLDLLFLSSWRSATVVGAEAVVPLARALILTLASGFTLWPMAWFLGGGRSIAKLALSQLELCWLATALVALGLLCSTLLRRISSAAAVAYLVVLVMVAMPLLIGPGVERLPGAEGLISAALVASPVTALASALEFDLMRSEVVYRWSPIGQRRFRYPAAGTVLAFQAGVLSLAFGGSVWSFSRQRRGRRY